MKMTAKDPSKKTSARKASEPKPCAFETSDGRRCRLPRSAIHDSLCVFRSREEQQLLESQKLGGELASSITGDFLTATDINYVLTRSSPPSRKTACPPAPPTPSPTLASSCSSLFQPSKKNSTSATNSSNGTIC